MSGNLEGQGPIFPLVIPGSELLLALSSSLWIISLQEYSDPFLYTWPLVRIFLILSFSEIPLALKYMSRGSFKTMEVVHALGLQQLKIFGILAFLGGGECGILILCPGLNLCPLHWKWGVLTTGPPGKPLSVLTYNLMGVSQCRTFSSCPLTMPFSCLPSLVQSPALSSLASCLTSQTPDPSVHLLASSSPDPTLELHFPLVFKVFSLKGNLLPCI